MRQAENRRAIRAGKGIKSRGFHLDRQDAFGPCSFDRRRRFAERRVRGPSCTDKKRLLALLKRGGRALKVRMATSRELPKLESACTTIVTAR